MAKQLLSQTSEHTLRTDREARNFWIEFEKSVMKIMKRKWLKEPELRLGNFLQGPKAINGKRQKQILVLKLQAHAEQIVSCHCIRLVFTGLSILKQRCSVTVVCSCLGTCFAYSMSPGEKHCARFFIVMFLVFILFSLPKLQHEQKSYFSAFFCFTK